MSKVTASLSSYWLKVPNISLCPEAWLGAVGQAGPSAWECPPTSAQAWLKRQISASSTLPATSPDPAWLSLREQGAWDQPPFKFLRPSKQWPGPRKTSAAIRSWKWGLRPPTQWQWQGLWSAAGHSLLQPPTPSPPSGPRPGEHPRRRPQSVPHHPLLWGPLFEEQDL